MDTLEDELGRVRRSLLDYRSEQPAANFLYCIANDEKHFYGLADREGEILLETTQAAFNRISETFTLQVLRFNRDGTQLWGLKARDIEKIDEEFGLLLVDLLVHKPARKVE